MQLSNCFTDEIAICINDDNMQIMFLMIFLIFNVCINIHENANYVD